MSLFCNSHFSPLQRRSIRQLGVAIFLTAALNIVDRYRLEHGHASALLLPLLAVLSVLPVVFAIWVVGRYLAAEQDEFIRVLVVRALLWGLAITMSGDAVAGVLMEYYSSPFPLALLNADLLFFSTGVAFRLLQRSYS